MTGNSFGRWLWLPMIAGACLMTLTAPSHSQSVSAPVRLYAAGSLREAMTEIARQYETETGVPVELTFGASGLLRERIEKGEPAQVFASADMDHPKRLAQAGNWASPQVFARNQMCALAAPSLNVTPDTLLDVLLKPDVRLGTSTPRADPSGDYAWALFRRADGERPGAYAVLDAKALKLTGSADSPQPPAGRNTYDWLMSEKRADIFITYCTNAASVKKISPEVNVVAVPAALQVAASYGVTGRNGDAMASRLAAYVQSPAARAVLAAYGFGQP